MADGTRTQLIDAGLRLFAIHGYDGVTTRQLSRQAGANLAAIAYHFGGKQGLYRAVLEKLVADTEPRFGPERRRLSLDPAGLRDCMRGTHRRHDEEHQENGSHCKSSAHVHADGCGVVHRRPPNWVRREGYIRMA